MSSIRLAAVAALIFMSTTVHAQGDACTDSDFSTFNASGSVTFDGFQPPELGINSTWTLSTAIVDKSYPSNNSALLLQTFWLDTTPFVDLSSEDIPLTGCAIVLFESGSPASTSADDSDSCSGVLTSACQQAIVDQVGNQSLGNSGSGPSTDELCSAYLSTTPPECSNNAYSIVATSDAMGNSLPPSCTNSSLGSGSATSASLIQINSSPITPSTSDSAYDIAVKAGTPVILTAWLKNGSGPEGWADTRVVCVTADDVMKGSRVPSAAERIAVGWVWAGVLGAGVAFALL